MATTFIHEHQQLHALLAAVEREQKLYDALTGELGLDTDAPAVRASAERHAQLEADFLRAAEDYPVETEETATDG